MVGSLHIAAFYHFAEVSDVEALSARLELEGRKRGLRGLIISASEGINGTISGLSREVVETYLGWISETLGFPPLTAKWSQTDTWPFLKFCVRVRTEIVTLGKPDIKPLPSRSATHLSPEQWDQALKDDNVQVLDTRNWYETRIGKFAGAIDPGLNEFHEFSDYLKKTELPKDKKYLIYCTGGIRCEKALVEMHEQGFNDVYQLDGGILNYIEKFPNRDFNGECFVFDSRVAVDQRLKPTRLYSLCPHCGQPADHKITCTRCDAEALVCSGCAPSVAGQTCSKNCAYHARLTPGKKGRPQIRTARFTKA